LLHSSFELQVFCPQNLDTQPLTGAGHGRGIVVSSEKASVTGAGRGSFPDRVAVRWTLGTGGVRGESFVISNFASYRGGEKEKPM